MRIGIVGCGIAGQAAAISLARDGHAVTVFERAAEARPIGAGLLLQPSGLAALDRLSLAPAAIACGARVKRLFGRTARGRVVMDLRYDDVADGVCGLGIHRGALFGILHRAMRALGVGLELAFDVVAIEPLESPCLIARDGRHAGPFDLVLDCAGAHHSPSAALRVRDTPYAWCALWTTCIDRGDAFAETLQQRYDRASTMIGILPIGRAPDATGNHVAFFWSLRLGDFARLRADGLDALKACVLRVWPEAGPVLDEIVSFDQLVLATYRDVRLAPFHRGSVLALGDAAHATSPQLGQGANLALIDAVTLAHALKAEAHPAAAFALYERLRRPHIRFYQLASRALTPVFQSDGRVLPWLRDRLFGPLGRAPLSRHVMRTTLAGTRLFPYGVWRLPPAER